MYSIESYANEVLREVSKHNSYKTLYRFILLLIRNSYLKPYCDVEMLLDIKIRLAKNLLKGTPYKVNKRVNYKTS